MRWTLCGGFLRRQVRWGPPVAGRVRGREKTLKPWYAKGFLWCPPHPFQLCPSVKLRSQLAAVCYITHTRQEQHRMLTARLWTSRGEAERFCFGESLSNSICAFGPTESPSHRATPCDTPGEKLWFLDSCWNETKPSLAMKEKTQGREGVSLPGTWYRSLPTFHSLKQTMKMAQGVFTHNLDLYTFWEALNRVLCRNKAQEV